LNEYENVSPQFGTNVILPVIPDPPEADRGEITESINTHMGVTRRPILLDPGSRRATRSLAGMTKLAKPTKLT